MDAVTVTSLCPTNKIAPHRRIASREPRQARTLRVFYDLLAPNRPYKDQLDDLQEQPQEDDPDDCGEIEDYDESDLSSVTKNGVKTRRHDKKLFGNFFRPSHPSYIPGNPLVPQRPQIPAARPPFWSGGIFGSNLYRPPAHQYPSNNIKPVHEYTADTYTTYRPQEVGGPLGYVVGYPPVRPTTRPRPDNTGLPFRFPKDSESRPRTQRTSASSPSRNIVGSFVNLFFK